MLVHPQFDPIAIKIGPLAVHWYGITYLIAFGLFMWLASRRARMPQHAAVGWTKQDVDDVLFYGVLGVVLGGRLGYCFFYKPDYYVQHLVEIVEVWKGGMSFHGGLLGVLFGLWLFGRRRKRSFFEVSDLIAPCVPTGIAAVRLGNFINGELWGVLRHPTCRGRWCSRRPTTLPASPATPPSSTRPQAKACCCS